MSTKKALVASIQGVLVNLLASLLVVSATFADDRDLLRDASGDPYMEIILDTSGSMHWTPPCSEIDACLDIDPYDGYCTTECTLGADLCSKLCPGDPTVDCVEYDFGADPPEAYEIIMDTENGDGISVTGNWPSSVLFEPYWGTSYLHNNNSGQGSKSVTYTPEIPADGTYQIYLFWNANIYRATNIPVDIVHADGTETISINQQDGGEDWNYIGTWDFERGTSGSITIRTDGVNNYVVADGLRMFTVIKPDSATCIRTGYRCQQQLCPGGDCQTPLHADDPRSKFFQARSALYEVIEEATNVHLGFATYEQDDVRVKSKLWLYQVAETQPDGDPQDLDFPFGTFYTFPTTSDTYPAEGSYHVFGNGAPYDEDGLGDGWNCANYDVPSLPGTGGAWYPERYNTDGIFSDPDGDAAFVSCFFSEPADLNNDWEMERARRLPKLGLYGDAETSVFFRDNDSAAPGQADGRMVRVNYVPVDDNTDGDPDYSYGDDTFAVDIEAWRCFTDACDPNDLTSSFLLGRNRVYFDLVSDFVAYEEKLGRSADGGYGYFHELWTMERDNDADCNGLEPNNDTFTAVDDQEDDAFALFNFKQPTVEDPFEPNDPDIDDSVEEIRSLQDPEGNAYADGRVDWFDQGDFVPIDWMTTNNKLVRERLAPNTSGTLLAVPDFRTATYWADDYIPGTDSDEGDPNSPTNRRLGLKDDDERSLLPIGRTPIAASLDDFRNWFIGDESQTYGGWSAVAAAQDLDWACRNKYVLFLTDGNETCGGDPCASARLLLDAGVSTYVVGFGVDDVDSDLGCIAEEGGTGEPLLPRNRQELVDTLQDILSQIRSDSKSFASASIPAIQSSAADKIYLSSFIPLPGEAFWPGEIDAFRKPLPVDDKNRPDTSRKCGNGVESACHLWEVGEVLVEQAPTLTDLSVGDYGIGSSFADERRVFFSQENLTGKRPNDLILFRPPSLGDEGTDTADLEDMAHVLVDEDVVGQYYADAQTIADNPGLTEDEIEALITADDLMAEVEEVLYETLRRKSLGALAEDDREEYVLGDIFHANPLVISSPSNFTYFSQDLCGSVQSKVVPNNCVEGVSRGYRNFANENTWRRRMMVAATNDGQLHFFDAGIRSVQDVDPLPDDPDNELEKAEVFSDGTGRELFSYMPRLSMPIVREQALGEKHIFSLDGEMVIQDVFIDPVDNAGGATAADREWRTVLMAGLREAGDVYEQTDGVEDFVSGYFALDITQPDILKQRESDKDGSNFNDPPLDSLLPVDSQQNIADEGDLPSCLEFDYSETGHQGTQTNGDGVPGIHSCKYPFPAELWQFTDSVENGQYFLDEDSNGVRDLGATWSKPVIGMIRVCDAGLGLCDPGDRGVTAKHVAIFGGGMDAEFKTSPERGNFLYMVDMETGEAIYKRELPDGGSAPAEPAVLDTNLDGILDVVYISTTRGTLYKVDLTRLDDNGRVPQIDDSVDVSSYALGYTDASAIRVTRIDDGLSDGTGAWDPFPILEAAENAPFYFPPTTFFVPELNGYGLVIGVGDREDLWVPTTKDGRVYTIVDDGLTRDDAAITDADLAVLAWDADPPTVTVDGVDEVDNSIDYLLEPEDGYSRGWVMTFPEGFRMTAKPSAISGILVYSVFQPIAFVPDTVDGISAGDDDEEDPVVCARTGVTRSFVVLARNANPIARLSGTDQGEDPEIDGTIIGGGGGLGDTGETSGAFKSTDRYHRIAEFTTAPFIDRTSSKNDPNSDGKTVDDLIQNEVSEGIREAIISVFPRGSRFNAAFQIAIAALRNSTGVNVYATVPIAIYPADWQER